MNDAHLIRLPVDLYTVHLFDPAILQNVILIHDSPGGENDYQ